nr:DUF4097 family beta strand repeat protein [Clostridia bacterium]
MKRSNKILLITSAVLFISGIIIMGFACAAVGGDYTKLTTENFAERYYEIAENIDSLDIDAVDCDVWLTESPDKFTRVTVVDSENIRTSVEVKDGTLHIDRYDTRKWFQMFSITGISDIEIRILVCLPKTELDSIDIKTASGDVKVTDLFTIVEGSIHTASGDIETEANFTGELELKAVSGNITAKNFSSSKCEIDTTSGDIALNEADFGELTMQTTSGDIKADKVTADANITVTTTSGYIGLEALTCINLTTKSTSGDTEIIMAQIKNLTESTAVSGDISFKGFDSGDFSIKTTSGDVYAMLFNGKNYIVNTTSGTVNTPPSVQGNGDFKVTTTSGDIDIVHP